MINLFRKIRKKLIKDGQLFRYLIYALGEILLIVIGILIAVKINNLNAERISRDEEVAILKEIAENLNECIVELDYTLDVDSLQFSKIKVVVNHMKNDLPYHDSLSYYFYNLQSFHVPEFPSSGFETLKSKGLELVKNQVLRKQLINMFDKRLEFTRESIIYDGRMRHREFHHSEYIEHFTILSKDFGDFEENIANIYINTNSKIVPSNYETLIKDQRYENFLRSIYDNFKWLEFTQLETLKMVKSLKLELEKEIMRLD